MYCDEGHNDVSGGAKSSGGRFAVAALMNLFHIMAGYFPPKTFPSACDIEHSHVGSPIHTPAVYCGV